jgi:hypothetical protein
LTLAYCFCHKSAHPSAAPGDGVLGGSGNNTFSLSNVPNTPALTLNGGGNPQTTLDFSPYVGDIFVDLLLGYATGVTGGISGFENVTGSQGNNLIVGDAKANKLIGGTGRNVLIGHGGGDTIDASKTSGDNILISASTDWDTNLAALQAIMKEWDRTDRGFDQRYSDLFSGNAGDFNQVNGQQVLLNKATVHADASADTVTGGSGHNWYLVDALDNITNYTPTGNKKTVVK